MLKVQSKEDRGQYSRKTVLKEVGDINNFFWKSATILCATLPWKLILVLSKGAIVVFATAPATPPAMRLVKILCWFGTYVQLFKIYN